MEKVDKILNTLPQFWKKDVDSNNYNFILSISSESSDIDSNLSALDDAVSLNTSSGVNLDDIGLLFNLHRRDNENDNSFRSRIKAYFQASLGGGSEPSMQTAIASSLGLEQSDVTINTLEPNIFDVTIAVDSSTDLTILNNVETVINTSKAAGMYFNTSKGDGGIEIESKDNLFLTNISKTSSEDTLL